MTTLSLRDLGFIAAGQAGAALWTPAQITTALWLDAADAATITTVSGAVSQWNDKSGNGRNAAQGTAGNRPTVSTWNNGGVTANALSFTSSQFLSGSVALTEFSIFAACNRFTAADAIEWVIRINNSSGGAMVFVGNLGDGNYSTGYSRNGSMWDSLGNGGTSKSFRGSFLCGANLREANGSENQLFLNFNGEYLTALLSGTGTSATSQYLIPQNLGCQLAELVILPSSANTATGDIVNGYLAWKWGLQGNLPAGHPYKSAAPTL